MKYLITLIALLTISFSQSKMVNQKPITEQIHENIQKALLLNQFSEGSRPIDEIQQTWSRANNNWKNSVRYTYEYNLAKPNDEGIPGLDYMTKWFFENGWAPETTTIINRNSDGEISEVIVYEAGHEGDSDHRISGTTYTGPFHDGVPTTQIQFETGVDGNLHPETKITRLFNGENLPNEIITYNSDYTEGWMEWVEVSRITIVYFWNLGVYIPENQTWWWAPTNTDDGLGKIREIIPMEREEYTYGQSDCTNDIVPYNLWNSSSYNNTRTDFYSYNAYVTPNLYQSLYGVTNYNSDNCLASETFTYFLINDSPLDRSLFWYNTPTGDYPNKSSTAYDNSETRLTRVESSYYDGQNWNNSRRSLYAYEGMSSLDTEDVSLLPIGFELKQNYPNPFNPITSISYELPQESNISIKIYNSLGHEIRTLVNEFKSVGQYQVTWDGLSNSGERVSDGTYFCQLKAGDFTQTKKMVLMK